MSRKPRAYRLDDPDVAETRPGEEPERLARVRVEIQPEEIVEAADGIAVPMGRKRRFPWGGILLSSLSALVALALGLAAESLVRGLFEAAPWLGWVGLAALVLAFVALGALVARELASLWREKKIEALRERANAALAARDEEAAKGVVAEVVALYAARPETARGRGRIRGRLAERAILARRRDRLATRHARAASRADPRRARRTGSPSAERQAGVAGDAT